MLRLEKEIGEKFSNTAKALRTRLDGKPSRDDLRHMITSLQVGEFRKCSKLGKSQLSIIVDNGGLAGVDGSTNTGGGMYPYVVTLQRAVAKSCSIDREISLAKAFSPLLWEDYTDEDDYREYVKCSLADLEVQAAHKALKQFKSKVMMMDGSLVRYKIEAADGWKRLREAAADDGTVLVGVVEGISTRIISSTIKNELPDALSYASDWEMLFGLLDVGEVLEMSSGLFKDGFCTCFMRSSRDPLPMGLDLLEEHQDYMEMIQDLIFTLTPENSRGIPVWLDIIDSKAKISNDIMEGLLRTYLGEDYLELIMPKRGRRLKL